jgi:diguanylate cyclase (GGDEF)-like protein/PAS domain S-box-containing protein
VFPLSWFATVMLGLLIVTPVLLITLSLADPEARDVMLPCSRSEAAALLAMLTAVTIGVFTQRYPLLFLPMVGLLAVTYRLGPWGAATGVLILAMIAPPLTALGYGPLAFAAQDRTVAVFFLQFYLLVSFGTALPLAALLTAQRRLARQCAVSERMHRLLADSSSDVIVRLTPDGIPVYVSPAVAGVLGYEPHEVIGRLSRNTIHPADRSRILPAWSRVLAGSDERLTLRLRRKTGGHAWLEIACRLVETEGMTDEGREREVVASVRDVTERRAAELAARESSRLMEEANRLLGMAERVAQVGHWRLTEEGQTLFWSPEVFRIHGRPPGEMPSLDDALEFYHPDDRARVTTMVGTAMEAGEPFVFEARIIRADGETRHVVSRGQPELGYDGQTTALFGVVQDVTRQVLAERELDTALRAAEEAAARAIHMAETDSLTGVASRRKALVVLDDAIAHAEATGASLALAIFDIDHFKQVNDRWGHGAGDAVLRRVARAAREAVRPTDLVGRLGGEEFVVILPGLTAANAVALAETVRRAIEMSGSGVEAGPPVTASIGIALLVPGGSAAALLSEADRALYRAKASGRNVARLAA